jgi:hypothetical protein
MRIRTTKGLHPVTQFTVRTHGGEWVSELSYTTEGNRNKGLRHTPIAPDYVTFGPAAKKPTKDGWHVAAGCH